MVEGRRAMVKGRRPVVEGRSLMMRRRRRCSHGGNCERYEIHPESLIPPPSNWKTAINQYWKPAT
jgi:hypothetical protein